MLAGVSNNTKSELYIHNVTMQPFNANKNPPSKGTVHFNSTSNRSPHRIQCNSSSNRSPYRIQCNTVNSGC